MATVIPKTAETGRPLRADARRNRELILEAARDVFADQGEVAQIDDVATRAGVGVGTVYRHFPNKEALLGEIVRQRFASFVENAEQALASDAEPFDAFAGLLRNNCEAMALDAGTQFAVRQSGESVWQASAAERETLHALGAKLISRARRAGSLRRDFTVDEIPVLMCGLAATMENDASKTAPWRRHLEILLDGLRAR